MLLIFCAFTVGALLGWYISVNKKLSRTIALHPQDTTSAIKHLQHVIQIDTQTLRNNIETQTKLTEDMRQNYTGMQQVMGNNILRGAYGEVQLQKLVELAGLQKGIDFETQVHHTGVRTEICPDMVIHLPGGKHVVIDAKAPKIDFAKDKTYETLVPMLRRHIKLLSNKKYHHMYPSDLDMVIMYVPSNVLLELAQTLDDTLFEYGVTHRIILTGPAGLIPVLRSYALLSAYSCAEKEMPVVRETVESHVKELNMLSREFTTFRNTAGKFVANLETIITSANTVFRSGRDLAKNRAINIEAPERVPPAPKAVLPTVVQ